MVAVVAPAGSVAVLLYFGSWLVVNAMWSSYK